MTAPVRSGSSLERAIAEANGQEPQSNDPSREQLDRAVAAYWRNSRRKGLR